MYTLFSATYILRKAGSECDSSDTWLGLKSTVKECAIACHGEKGCRFFVFGTGWWDTGKCYWEHTQSAECPEGWDSDTYDFYESIGMLFMTQSFKFTT